MANKKKNNPKQKNKTKAKDSEERKKKTEAMRKIRQAIRNDPIAYEESKRKERERYHKRKAEGKIKLIKDLKEREKRIQRKAWRNHSKKFYLTRKQKQRQHQQFLNENTPPPSPQPVENVVPAVEPERQIIPPLRHGINNNYQASLGRKKRRKNREQEKRKLEDLELQLKKEKARSSRYKKRYQRVITKKDPTPRKRVQQLLRGHIVPPIIKDKLLFGEVMSAQLKENFQKQRTPKQKRRFISNVHGHVIKRYRFQTLLASKLVPFSGSKLFRTKSEAQKKKIERLLKIKQVVTCFYEKDENTRMCPGKRDTITFHKIKKQKRYISDTLKNLHKKFLAAHPDQKIGYSLFCKLRPFWVLQPDARKRETCMCIVHANMDLLVSALRKNCIIKEKTSSEVVKSLVCNGPVLKETCLERSCQSCVLREVIMIQNFEENNIVRYEKWVTKKVKLLIKGTEKLCQKTAKETITCSKEDLIAVFKKSLEKYLLHTRNIIHQHRIINSIKKNLSDNEILCHIDFSENYVCKYNCEIQSVHFGSSKPQITLHTGVLYHKDKQTLQTVPTSFCTLSKSLRHDPAAICCHLEPIIAEMKNQVPDLKTIHFLSDGPATQYKNKKMFYLMCSYLSDKLNVEKMYWHYSESGHGKGAPDGIGGYIKRTADSIVARGSDLADFETLLRTLKEVCTGVKILCIDENRIEAIDALLPNQLQTFKGTMQIRQITWAKNKRWDIYLRKLSCIDCDPSTRCDHFDLGTVSYLEFHPGEPLRYSDVYSTSSDEENDRETFQILPSNYVVVKLTGKKDSFRHFIAVVLSVERQSEFTVKFLRRAGSVFVFPDIEDISCVDRQEIVCVLNNPCINHRDQYSFDNDLNRFEKLH